MKKRKKSKEESTQTLEDPSIRRFRSKLKQCNIEESEVAAWCEIKHNFFYVIFKNGEKTHL